MKFRARIKMPPPLQRRSFGASRRRDYLGQNSHALVCFGQWQWTGYMMKYNGVLIRLWWSWNILVVKWRSQTDVIAQWHTNAHAFVMLVLTCLQSHQSYKGIAHAVLSRYNEWLGYVYHCFRVSSFSLGTVSWLQDNLPHNASTASDTSCLPASWWHQVTTPSGSPAPLSCVNTLGGVCTTGNLGPNEFHGKQPCQDLAPDFVSLPSSEVVNQEGSCEERPAQGGGWLQKPSVCWWLSSVPWRRTEDTAAPGTRPPHQGQWKTHWKKWRLFWQEPPASQF
jgi:hypothetical protein